MAKFCTTCENAENTLRLSETQRKTGAFLLALHLCDLRVSQPAGFSHGLLVADEAAMDMMFRMIDDSKAACCPACGHTPTEIVKEWRLGGEYRAMACWECGLLFAHPQPPPDLLGAYYSPSGGWTASRADPQATKAQVKAKGKAGRAVVALLNECFPDVSRPRVLDFGCGTGSWLNTFQDAGWETFGIEPATDAAFVRHQRLTAIPADGDFHVVMAYHVLEHLPRPLETLASLTAPLRSGGFLFLSVPRLDTVAVHRDFGYCLAPPHHLVAFTEACLRGLLGRCGLETVRALHDMDQNFTKGRPVRLRLLARKSNAPVTHGDPAAALRGVIQSLDASVAPERG